MKVTQKITIIYLIGFVLFAGFAILTVLSGTSIQKKTAQLAQQGVPGLIAVSTYKTYLQSETIRLYELYATADYASFEKVHNLSKVEVASYLLSIKQLPQYASVKAKVEKLSEEQEKITKEFTKIMQQPNVNWDQARLVLAEFARVSEEVGAALDDVVTAVSADTAMGADESHKQTETLINTALVLTLITFVIGVLAAYFTHKKIATPLHEVSEVLTGIAARKDLTCRVKQYGNDEVGDIANAANKLLDEFQRLAQALDSSTQELNRTANNLIAASDEIHQDEKSTQRQLGNVKVISGKLQGLAQNLQAQFRLLNF